MEDGSQPEYAFAGGERDNASIARFDLSLHISSAVGAAWAETRSAVFMAMSLSDDASTGPGESEMKRAETRKERGAAWINGRERIHDDRSRCMRSKRIEIPWLLTFPTWLMFSLKS